LTDIGSFSMKTVAYRYTLAAYRNKNCWPALLTLMTLNELKPPK